MPKIGYSLGIDLGTSNTHAAFVKHNKADHRPCEYAITIPSYVAFTSAICLVGSLAKLEAERNPSNTIFDALRFLGRRYKEPETKAMVEQYPFRITEHCGFIAFEIDYRGKRILVTPVLILSMILHKCLRKIADRIGKGYKLLGVSITVPVAFNFSQRQLVRHAAQIANLGPVHIMDCTSAACLQYSRTFPSTKRRIMLIIDCGAGFLDMTIATEENIQTVVRKGCGMSLARNEDVDALLLDVMREKIDAPRSNPSHNPALSPQELYWLRGHCHSAKVKLSEPLDYESNVVKVVNPTYDVKMRKSDRFPHGDVQVTLGDLRRCFEGLSSKLSSAIPALLLEAQTESSDLTDVIFAGGTSNVPFLHLMLCNILRRHLTQWCPQHEAANAQGAAYHAATMLTAADPAYCGRRILVDIPPTFIYSFLDRDEQQQRVGVNEIAAIKPPIGSTILTSMHHQRHHTLEIWEANESQQIQEKCLGRFTIYVLSESRQLSGVWIKTENDTKSQITIIAKGCDDAKDQRVERLIIYTGLTAAELEESRDLFESLSLIAGDRFLARHVTMSSIHGILKETQRVRGQANMITSTCQSQLQVIASLAEELLDALWDGSTKTATQHYSIRQRLRQGIQGVIDESPEVGVEAEKLLSFAEQVEQSAITTLENMTLAERKRVRARLYPRRSIKEVDTAMAVPFQLITDSSRKEMEGGSRVCKDQGVLVNDESDTLNHESRVSDHAPVASEEKQAQQDQTNGRDQGATYRLVATRSSARTLHRSTIQVNVVGADDCKSVITRMIRKANCAGFQYADSDFVQLADVLRISGKSAWSLVPRLYIVLRIVDQLQLLDAFLEQGITDIWFPFTHHSLPNTLSPTARARILDCQHIVMSKTLLFESSEQRQHAHFAQGKPLPYKTIAKLGAGAHAHVDKVVSTVSHREFARKVFRRHRAVEKDGIRSFLVELQVLKKIQHFHCVELMQSYTDPKYFALIMLPVAEFNMCQYFTAAASSSDKLSLLRTFFGCLANALQYCHSIQIRHRDIKPQNILVKGDRVFLSDFGIALDWQNLSRSTTTADSGKTWVYAAPEVARYEKRNSAADVWSLGCVFMEMVTVLKGRTTASMRSFFEARSSNYRFYGNVENLGLWAKELRGIGDERDNAIFGWVRGMLAQVAKDRPTAFELYDHIVRQSKESHVPFCGSCCVDDLESSSVEGGDEDDLWEQAAEMTVTPGNSRD